MAVEHDFTTLDSCEDPSKWNYGGDASAPVLNTTEYVEGSGSLDLGKSGSSSTDFWYETTDYYDLSGGKTIAIQLYIADKDTLDKLSEVWIYVTDSSGNYSGWSVKNGINRYNWKVTDPLHVGWNRVRIGYMAVNYSYMIPVPYVSNGTPNLTSVRIKILFRTNNSSDTIASGKIKIDWLRSGGYIKFYGGTSANPYDNNDFKSDIESIYNWGFIDFNGDEYIFFIKATFTDYIQLDGFTFTYNVISYYKITDEYSVGKISNTSFIANSPPQWQGRQSPQLLGEVLFEGCSFSKHGDIYATTVAIIGSGVTFSRSTTVGSTSISGGSRVVSGLSISGFRLYLYNQIHLGNSVIDIDRLSLYYNESENRFYSVAIMSPLQISSSTAGEHKIIMYNPILVSDIDYNNSGGWFTVEYWFGIKAKIIDEADNPISDATVNIYDESLSLVGSTTTDSNGVMADEILVLRRRAGKDSSGNPFDDKYRFKLEVVKDSTVYYSAWLEIDSRFLGTIRVYNAYMMSGWVSEDLIQIGEPIIIYAKITDWSGSPMSGLDVYADVTKPDHTVVTVVMNEDPFNPGLYNAEFDQTDLVGSYTARIYATIKGNLIETYDYFSVGILESKIDEVKSLLKKHDAKLDAYKWID